MKINEINKSKTKKTEINRNLIKIYDFKKIYACNNLI